MYITQAGKFLKKERGGGGRHITEEQPADHTYRKRRHLLIEWKTHNSSYHTSKCPCFKFNSKHLMQEPKQGQLSCWKTKIKH